METLEYRTVDKATWGEGPWQTEPDKKQWRDPVTGLPCLIVRGPVGSWCGYVGVEPGHPLHGKEYGQAAVFPCSDECTKDYHYACRPEAALNVHGGLTFSGACREGATEAVGICHLPGEGEPADVWWLGFDCAHAGDYAPGLDRIPALKYHDRYTGKVDHEVAWPEDTYKTQGYVEREVTELAQQIEQLRPVTHRR